ncbi:pirin family protein [Granulicoccus sp. GXG6511]|uniref:pirin family protein n=1 Tax=Granulicoccus sp. GXG6511 TaxID=3381351 RepID=UPI003D7D8A5B
MEIRRSAEREITRLDWLVSRSSFSGAVSFDPRFGHPRNTHHGLLVTHNEDTVEAGWGFDTHRHRNMEIVTWVLSGSVVHIDDRGHTSVITPGQAQRMTAGTGILHSERNDAWRHDPSIPRHDDPAHVVQMWVVPDAVGVPPSYAQADVTPALESGELIPIVSGLPAHRGAALGLQNGYAGLSVARLRASGAVELPAAAYMHLFVARGAVDLEGAGRLDQGDAARLTNDGGHRVTALADAEILVWEMTRGLAS